MRRLTSVVGGRGSARVPVSYRAIQGWALTGVAAVYRRVEVTSRSRVPRDRPAILAANHSSALADVALIIARMPTYPRFLAAASWWRWPPVRLLFHLGGVVPIQRRRDGETDQNASSFEACHEALGTGAHLAIFPEGEMNLGTALLPLKTGAARIALGAADAGVTGIVIVPVGLVYDDRGRWRSDVEIQFGEPIEIDAWVEPYRVDPMKAVRTVTDLLADRLAEVTVNHGSLDEATLVERAAALVLADTTTGTRRDCGLARRNELRRALAASLAIAGGETSEEHHELRSAVDAHSADLLALGVTDERAVPILRRASRIERARNDAELSALTFPALLGAVANAPTVCVVSLANVCVRNASWNATTMGVGLTFLSPVVWTVEYVALSRRLGRRRAFAFTAAGAAGGFAALAWRERWRRRRQIRWRDEVEARDPALLAGAAASRAVLREQVMSLAGAGPAGREPEVKVAQAR